MSHDPYTTDTGARAMSTDKLRPSDVEGFLMAIHPDSVPPELVADAAPLFLSLRIAPDDAARLMHAIERAAMVAGGWTEMRWRDARKELSIQQGWQPPEHWADRANRRAHIDATVARSMPWR